MLNTLAIPSEALVDVPQISETIQKGVDAFMEAVPSLMRALEAVASVHPCITGASSLFRINGGIKW